MIKTKMIMIVPVLAMLFGSVLHAGDQPVVKFVFMADAEPTCWEENGTARGFQPEMTEYLMGKLGIKVIFEFYPWARAQQRIKEGKADCMVTTPTVPRFEYAVFGKEYATLRYYSLFIKRDNSKMAEAIAGFTKLEDLKPYSLVDFIGNGWTKSFMKKGYDIHAVARLEMIPDLLVKGRHDLTIVSSTAMNWWAAKKGIRDQLREFEINWPWTRFHHVYMVSRKSPWVEKGLIRALDEELKKMKETGAWDKLREKYKDAHFGKPFTSYLDSAYESKHGFYAEYDNYPVCKP